MSRPEQILFAKLLDEDWEAAKEQLVDDPSIICRMGWLGVGCSGRWGMPIYACISHLLDPGSELSKGSDKFRKSIQMREISELVFKAADSLFTEGSGYDKYGLRAQYALRAGWIDILEECALNGVNVEEMQAMVAKIKNVPYVVTEWIENGCQIIIGHNSKPDEISSDDDDTCCICIDVQPDAIYYPCAHKSFCFACSRDLKNCPICRIEGYAKLMSK